LIRTKFFLMKKIIPAKKVSLQLSSGILIALFTVIAFSSVKASSIYPKNIRTNLKDSIVINKISENKDYNIELSPGDSPHKLLISINKHQKKVYHFYMFDVNGKLKAQVDILNNEKISFVNIEKGNYYYEILCNEVRIENGQLTVK
jgi:hypothetical protein